MEDTFLQQKGYLDLKSLVYSLVVVLYFAVITAVNQVKSGVFSAAFYGVMLLGALVFFSDKGALRLRPVLFIAFGAMILGICNILFVGNLTWVLLIILMLSFLMAVFFLDGNIDENAFRMAMDVNALVITVKLLLHGKDARVFVDTSNNYISVHLLAPIVIYYSLLDARGKKAPLLPAVVSWVLSLWAGGRGGFLACTILLGGMLISRFFKDETTKRERIILAVVILLAMIPAIVIVVQSFLNRFSDLYVVSRFTDKGMDGGRRLECWIDYIRQTLESPGRILFGTPLDEVPMAIYYEGNLHNAYLFVHVYLGLGGFIFVPFMFARAAIYAMRKKKWIYFWCIMAFAFRGLTDHVFGVNRLTVVVLALVFLPDIMGWKNKKKENTEGEKNANFSSYSGTCGFQGDTQ